MSEVSQDTGERLEPLPLEQRPTPYIQHININSSNSRVSFSDNIHNRPVEPSNQESQSPSPELSADEEFLNTPINTAILNEASEFQQLPGVVDAIMRLSSAETSNIEDLLADAPVPQTLRRWEKFSFKYTYKNYRTSLYNLPSKVKDAFLTALREVTDTLKRPYEVMTESATTILDKIKTLMKFIVDYVGSYLGNFFSKVVSSITDLAQKVMMKVLTTVGRVINIKDYGCLFAYIVSAMIMVFAIVNPCIAHSFSRIFLCIMAGIMAYYKSIGMTITLSTGVFLYWKMFESMPSMRHYVHIKEGTIKMEPQSTAKEDLKMLIAKILSTTVMVCAGIAGLPLPKSGADMEAIMKRHVLLARAHKSWEELFDRAAETIDAFLMVVNKHVFGREYNSIYHIAEVEDLCYEVIRLMSLQDNLLVGRDEKTAVLIEQLQIKMTTLLRIYGNNAKIKARLMPCAGLLMTMYYNVLNKNPRAQVMRREPVCMVFHGPSGVGKTRLIQLIAQDLLKISGHYRPGEDIKSFIYSRNQEQEFWDGYQGQPVVVVDDFGQQKDSVANPNLDFFELIRASNIFPWNLHSAALSEKANNPYLAHWILVTTNLPISDKMQIPSLIEPSAVLRRMHLKVKVGVIPEVQKNPGQHMGHMIDRQKLKEWQAKDGSPKHHLKHMIFTVEGEQIGYHDLLRKLSERFVAHDEAHQELAEDVMNARDEPLPPGCHSVMKEWMTPQSEEGPEPLFALPYSHYCAMDHIAREYMQKRGNVLIVHKYDEDIWEAMRMTVPAEYEAYIRKLPPVQITSRVIPYEDLIVKPKIEVNVNAPLRNWDWGVPTETVVRTYEHVVQSMQNAVSEVYSASRDALKVLMRWTIVVGSVYCMYQALKHSMRLARSALGFFTNPPINDSAEINDNLGTNNDEDYAMLGLPIQNVSTESKHAARSRSSSISVESKHQARSRSSSISVESKHSIRSRKNSIGVENLKPNESLLSIKEEPEYRSGIQMPKVDALCVKDKALHEMFAPLFKPEGIISSQADALEGVMRRNIYKLELQLPTGKAYIGMVFVVRGLNAVCNFHYMELIRTYLDDHEISPEEAILVLSQYEQQKGHEIRFQTFLNSAQRVKRGPLDTEFLLVQMPPSCPRAANITKHLVTAQDCTQLSKGVRLLMFSFENGENPTRIVRDGHFRQFTTVELPSLARDGKTHRYASSVMYDMSSKRGDCCAPIVIANDCFQRKLLGFHFGGGVGTGACAMITRDDITPLLIDKIVDADPVLISTHCLEDFPLKEGSFSLIGSNTRPVPTPTRSKIEPSLLHGIYEPKTRPAYLAPPLEPDGPMLKGLKKNAQEVRVLNEAFINHAVDSYKRKLFSYEPREVECRILSYEQACMGIPGDEFFPPVQRVKSAGWPFMLFTSEGKGPWLGQGDWDFSSDEARFLRAIVLKMEQQCQEGIIPEAYFVDTLKDERRILEKFEQKKTRVFSACPLPLTILFRKYFLGFVAFMTRNKIDIECCVGTNVHSADWGKIANKIRAYKNVVAGDFSNFDGTVQYPIFSRIVDIVNEFYDDNATNQRVRTIIWEMICKSKHLLGPHVYQFSHGQPSGNPATAPMNSIYVSLIMRYAWAETFCDNAELFHGFNNNVSLVCYGDDFVCSVGEKASKLFNPGQIAASLEGIGMKITNEDKTEMDAYFRKIKDVTFLKRGFAYSERFKWWFAPLDLDTVCEMVMWVRKSPDIEKATLDNIQSAVTELYHHDYETYSEVLEHIRSHWKLESSMKIIDYGWHDARRMMSLGCWGKIFDKDNEWI